jgi:hypothetical protein
LTTTLQPGEGAGVSFTQAGTGTTPGYSAIDLRRILTGCLQEGVVEAGAFEVTERGAGANMSVDIAADVGFAYVQGDSITAQGLYCVPPHSATINETITTADSSNPRVDQVILEIRDNTHDASGGNEARIRVVAGTPTSGATLNNRSGAAVKPGSAIVLADVLVPASDTSISNSQIRDRRPWARGAFSAMSTTTSYTATTQAALDTTNLQRRLEISSGLVRVSLGALFAPPAAECRAYCWMDGSLLSGTPTGGMAMFYTGGSSTDQAISSGERVVAVASGSHLFTMAASGNSGTNNITSPFFVVEEIVRENAANNPTTTG